MRHCSISNYSWEAVYDTGEILKEGDNNPNFDPEKDPPERKFLSVSHLDATKVTEIRLYSRTEEKQRNVNGLLRKALNEGKIEPSFAGTLETELSYFDLSQYQDQPKFVCKVNLAQGERFIKFWRRFVPMMGQVKFATGNVAEVLGIQKTVAGHNVKFLVFINNAGDVIVSTDHNQI